MLVFIDDDERFTTWREAHPEDHVLNCERKPNSSYLVLHRATCAWLGMKGILNWTKDYINVCSVKSGDIDRWIKENVSLQTHATSCGKCKPSA